MKYQAESRVIYSKFILSMTLLYKTLTINETIIIISKLKCWTKRWYKPISIGKTFVPIYVYDNRVVFSFAVEHE